MSSPPPSSTLPPPIATSPPVLTPEEMTGVLRDLTLAVQDIQLYLAGSYGPPPAAATTGPSWLPWQPPALAASAAFAGSLQPQLQFPPAPATTGPPLLPWQPPLLAASAAVAGPLQQQPWLPWQPPLLAASAAPFGPLQQPLQLQPPAPTEPTSGSYSRSYVEQTVQRGDNRSSGSKQKLGYGSNAYLSEDGSYSQAQDNYAPSYHQNGKAPDFHAEEPRPLAYSSGVVERPPPQRQWVPPQPPGVAMPEAAAAIRQQKSLTKQPSSDMSEAAGEVQVNGAASSPSVAAAEVPVNGSAASDAGRSEIEEQVEAV